MLPAQYSVKEAEDRLYRMWKQSGYFNPDKLPRRNGRVRAKAYTIMMPPPNVTGVLHMGHALNNTMQDILIRWKRMQGYKTLWIPGTDHAGIATQNVVEKDLKKQGLTRFDLGREEFIKRVWEWKDTYGGIILGQLERLGISADWSRTAFTMDPAYVEAVAYAFTTYYKRGWIYKGKRVVNWCHRCGTSLSDLELEYQEEQGNLYYITYPIKGSSEHITVATSRPETMLGDEAVAVNPKDPRYASYKEGETILLLPLRNKEIPLIKDRLIDIHFGTGALKVTPAHDLVDYELAQRHNLPLANIINQHGKMESEAGEAFAGMPIAAAREKVVEELQKIGALEKIEPYTHNIATCYRCGTTIENLLSTQWFLKMDELALLALQAVKDGHVTFHPKKWEKAYRSWLTNVKDWCISRQIWWGHRVPLDGETDVLDTWFSSALWPMATLGWPRKTKDFQTFYPTALNPTARDIINLWTARMVFSGIFFTKKAPFRDVYIHATVLNKEGKRMSKSLGTGIDPMNLIEQYGADAVRFGLAYQNMGLQDIKFDEAAIVAGRKFSHKIWNASRFVLMQVESYQPHHPAKASPSWPLTLPAKEKLHKEDAAILKKLKQTRITLDRQLGAYQFGQAAHTLYDFFWHDFCDVYIEKVKTRQDKEKPQVLLYVLASSLKMLHPFMPFVTEEIYSFLPLKEKKMLIVEEWPK